MVYASLQPKSSSVTCSGWLICCRFVIPLAGLSWYCRRSYSAFPPLAPRLRPSVDPAEAQIALESVLRRDKLDAAARVQLFATLAEHFRSLIRFPETATLGLSDEQYVRDVVDLLFRQSVEKQELGVRI